jgi:hypothetical protein
VLRVFPCAVRLTVNVGAKAGTGSPRSLLVRRGDVEARVLNKVGSGERCSGLALRITRCLTLLTERYNWPLDAYTLGGGSTICSGDCEWGGETPTSFNVNVLTAYGISQQKGSLFSVNMLKITTALLRSGRFRHMFGCCKMLRESPSTPRTLEHPEQIPIRRPQ